MEGDERQRLFATTVELAIQFMRAGTRLGGSGDPAAAAARALETVDLNGNKSLLWLDGACRYYFGFDEEIWPEFIREVITDAVAKGVELKLASDSNHS